MATREELSGKLKDLARLSDLKGLTLHSDQNLSVGERPTFFREDSYGWTHVPGSGAGTERGALCPHNLVVETAKFNVATAHSAQEAKQLLSTFSKD